MYKKIIESIKESISYYNHKEVSFSLFYAHHDHYSLNIRSNIQEKESVIYSVDLCIIDVASFHLAIKKDREEKGKIKQGTRKYNDCKEGSYGYYLIDRNTLDTFILNKKETIEYATKYIIEDNKPNINLIK